MHGRGAPERTAYFRKQQLIVMPNQHTAHSEYSPGIILCVYVFLLTHFPRMPKKRNHCYVPLVFFFCSNSFIQQFLMSSLNDQTVSKRRLFKQRPNGRRFLCLVVNKLHSVISGWLDTCLLHFLLCWCLIHESSVCQASKSEVVLRHRQ